MDFSNVKVVHADSGKHLDKLEEESFDSCVTDPPYELGFMDKKWDRSGITFDPTYWKKLKRVMKPGAHVAVFGGSRTFHRVAVGIEDAGFEIRDTIDWVYGSGFAKSHKIDDAIKKHFEREERTNRKKENVELSKEKSEFEEVEKWEGWDTQLKPAKEPIIIARKPLEGTVAENVLNYGTGGLNIGQCRIGYSDLTDVSKNPSLRDSIKGGNGGKIIAEEDEERFSVPDEDGRWPPNVIFDKFMAKKLDEQSGTDLSAGGDIKAHENKDFNTYGKFTGAVDYDSYGDEGGASRYFKVIDYNPYDNIGFFYCPKAKRAERDLGCENDHITVKPIELISYLVRLLTPEGGEVIDPFAGSGTTGLACLLEDRNCLMIEMEKDYVSICEKRLKYTKDNYRDVSKMIYGDNKNSITKEEKTIDHNFWE